MDKNSDGMLTLEEVKPTTVRAAGRGKAVEGHREHYRSASEDTMKAIVTCLVLGLSVVALLAAESAQQQHPQSTGNPPATADRSNAKDETSAAVRQGPRQLKPAEHGVGRMVPDVDFQDIEGHRHKLSEWGSHELTVVAVTSTSCPISKRYLPTLAQLEKSYGDRKVAFIFVNPTPSDSDEDIRAAIQSHDLRGPYVRDSEGKLLGPLGATTTAECFVLDRARTLVYRGAVDDQYGFGYGSTRRARNCWPTRSMRCWRVVRPPSPPRMLPAVHSTSSSPRARGQPHLSQSDLEDSAEPLCRVSSRRRCSAVFADDL